jgi:hypothetical protein
MTFGAVALKVFHVVDEKGMPVEVKVGDYVKDATKPGKREFHRTVILTSERGQEAHKYQVQYSAAFRDEWGVPHGDQWLRDLLVELKLRGVS